MKRLLAVALVLGAMAFARESAKFYVDLHSLNHINLAGCTSTSPSHAHCTNVDIEFTAVSIHKDQGNAGLPKTIVTTEEK